MYLPESRQSEAAVCSTISANIRGINYSHSKTAGGTAMAWNLEEAIGYYKKQGAPSDQSSLICLMMKAPSSSG